MQSIAIIPARGGSKRIPRKNIRLFCGKPIIAYSIEAAIAANVFDRVIVSTDSEEIAETAVNYGAEVPFLRPAELSDDCIRTGLVVLHALDALASEEILPELVCCIYATAPFLQPKYLKAGFELLQGPAGYNAAYSVTTYAFPIFRAVCINERGSLEEIWPEYESVRSQALPEAYHDAGQFYIARVSAFRAAGYFSMPGARPVVLPRYLVQDIDTPEDWRQAEIMFKVLAESGYIQNGRK